MKLSLMYSYLNTDLAIIEKELEASIKGKHPVLQQAGLHLLQSGGKRLRPVFVLLGGKFGKYDIDVIKNVAVTLELIHTASLVHDDVIDDADIRRGRPTIKAKWDNKIAMYAGDYILGSSLEIITKLPNPLLHKLLAHTIVEVCLGEIEQIKDKYRFDQNLRCYLRRIKRKTALLIASSCQLGAVAAEVPADVHKKLFLYGYYVGMAFQITDDILDFTSSDEQLGKPAGSDLLQGNITLPVLYAMKDQNLKQQIIQVSERTTASEIKPLIKAIKQSDAIIQAEALSNRYLEKAYKILEELPSSRARNTLYNVAKYIGKRKF
ncbi:heptaprenyl diphosphate synthase component II [Bacillus sp. REN16]|uniref:heptaprenyl diphosphate synthase component II n=1 Tax=Bacillus sp. REN16 TaxID=2887296 RepID=UPI001E4763B7|nr:heptaprenyl diphosphate synthase component II [Bacillus sp. REN16]MCC3358320.1 heptaprenyl diphosphate synthase component II [Bacillus sp. REN16]